MLVITSKTRTYNKHTLEFLTLESQILYLFKKLNIWMGHLLQNSLRFLIVANCLEVFHSNILRFILKVDVLYQPCFRWWRRTFLWTFISYKTISKLGKPVQNLYYPRNRCLFYNTAFYGYLIRVLARKVTINMLYWLLIVTRSVIGAALNINERHVSRVAETVYAI